MCAKRVCWLLILAAIIAAPLTPLQVARAAALPQEMLEVSYSFEAPQVQLVGDWQRVTLAGLINDGEPGAPSLPVRIAHILLPAGRQVASVQVVGESVALPGDYRIEPAQAAAPLDEATQPISPTAPLESIYQNDTPYPAEPLGAQGVQTQRGWQTLAITLHPVQYAPPSGKLSYYPQLTVRVQLEMGGDADAMLRPTLAQRQQDLDAVRVRVDNPELADRFDLAEQPLGSARSGALDPALAYDYLIITNQALANATGPNNWQALAAAKQARGVRTLIQATEWIAANYSGEDLAAKIRSFILDAYRTWGIEYVLLGGDGDGSSIGGETQAPIVPARGLLGTVLSTSGNIVDQSIASDMYYACLDGSFDGDGDRIYGETNDGPGGSDVDLLAEVYVGRAAVDSAIELANFVRKTLAYEADNDPYLKNVWLVGENLGASWPAPWGGDRKDDTRFGATAAGYSTTGFENSAYADFFDTNTLYDRDYPTHDWPTSEIISAINSPAHLINHLGHTDLSYLMRMTRTDVTTKLNNTHYFIGYSQGCYAGSFDNKKAAEAGGGYDSVDSIVEKLTVGSKGAVAFIANARYGWTSPSDPHAGSSQMFDRLFWDAVLRENLFALGRAHQAAKEDVYALVGGGLTGSLRWVYFELNLFGDPELRIKTSTPSLAYESHVSDDDNLGASVGDDDGIVEAGETVELTVTLRNLLATSVRDIYGSLRTDDPYVTLLASEASFGEAPANGATANAGPYVLAVSDQCPEGHSVVFEMELAGTVDGVGPQSDWMTSFQVQVYHQPPAPVARVFGTVRDHRTGGIIGGAVVEAWLDASLVATGYADGAGAYDLPVEPATYNLRVRQTGYAEYAANVTVGQGVQVARDVSLQRNAPWLDADPGTSETSLPRGQARTTAITIRNNGAAQLNYTLVIPAGAPWLATSRQSGSVAANGAQQITLTLDSSHVARYGWYETQVQLSSNDPVTPLVILPVRMGALQYTQMPVLKRR